MAKLILFRWTGWLPGEGETPGVSYAAAFPSQAAFMRATGFRRSDMAWVSIDARASKREDQGNEGARLALANPGTVYWRDSLHHSAENVWHELS